MGRDAHRHGADVLGVYVRPGDRTMPFMLPADRPYLHDFPAAPVATQWDGLLFVGQSGANAERVTRGLVPAPIAPAGIAAPAVVPLAAGVGVGAGAGALVPVAAGAARAAGGGIADLSAAAAGVGGLGGGGGPAPAAVAPPLPPPAAGPAPPAPAPVAAVPGVGPGGCMARGSRDVRQRSCATSSVAPAHGPQPWEPSPASLRCAYLLSQVFLSVIQGRFGTRRQQLV